MKISHWIAAFRLRTLFLSLSCIWAGLICAQNQGLTNWAVGGFTLLTALLLQILSNLANDYGDSIHGADHDGRKGPKRAVQSGNISKENMKTALILFAILSFVSGCILLFVSMPIIGMQATLILLAIGIASILAAIGYTNGKRPYGYMGLGDISVFIFFGFVSVMGAQYLQTNSISENALLLSISFGCLSVGVLNLNNMRDIPSDNSAGKNSIPVRLGLSNAKIYHYLLLLIAGFGLNLFIWNNHLPIYVTIGSSALVLLNLFLAWKAKEHLSFDPLLKWLSLSSFVIAFLIQLGL
ncbi:MAG: 1,4-dihydroxy-2-naphthoate octaprenyltransferase [Bacteroidia bacterium]|nr:1,4-dihydroxy-2-naphthoate octaprenyltransferase [Bacteroidia bacterium]MCF8425774.1 1,4-dihydroxy-2-naphthoate octaprenyltransferase [Bacteroidia bacterium]MCF8447177.1 1,4-dihydroxy-2-naphthoate octaprenyltransferase [Bacteroidia bacterium]